MASSAILGIGSKLYYSTNSGSTYTEVADLQMLGDAPTAEAEKVDVTPVAPTNYYREKRSGLIEPGTFEFDQTFTKARMTVLRTFQANKTLVRWKVVPPDNADPTLASNEVFDGYVVRSQLKGMKNNDKVVISCKVEVSGGTTFTEGS